MSLSLMIPFFEVPAPPTLSSVIYTGTNNLLNSPPRKQGDWAIRDNGQANGSMTIYMYGSGVNVFRTDVDYAMIIDGVYYDLGNPVARSLFINQGFTQVQFPRLTSPTYGRGRTNWIAGTNFQIGIA